MDALPPMNPMATPTFAARPGAMVGMSVWVLQTHHSNRAPIWNGPLPDESAADALIAHINEIKEAIGHAAGEDLQALHE